MLTEIMNLRYAKVTQGLVDNWFSKTVMSILGTAWATLTEIMYVEPSLLGACIIASLIDLYTGVSNSRKRGIAITSFGFRQFFAKVIEFGLVIILFTVAAKSFGVIEGNSWVTILFEKLKHIHYFAYFWVFWTEMKSIIENIGGQDSRYFELWEMVKNKLFKHMKNND